MIFPLHHGISAESSRNQHGFSTDSARIQYGINTEAAWVLEAAAGDNLTDHTVGT